METIDQVQERIAAQPGALAQQSSNTSHRREQLAEASRLTAVVWQFMTSMYGHTFQSAFGAAVDPDGVWRAAVADLTEVQVRHGLRRVMDSGKEFPPGAPLFRALCLNTDQQEHWEHARQRADAIEGASRRALPPPRCSDVVARHHLNEMRANLGLPIVIPSA